MSSEAKGLNLESEDQIAKMSEIHHFSAPELDHLKILRQGSNDEAMLKTFRDLRSQVYTKANGSNFSCMVTSIVSGGGASFVARNLSAAIALDKSKTAAIVDCNFYAPTTHELLSAEINIGLTDYLNVRDMGIEYVVYASGIPRVRVIPCGNNARFSAERLATAKMSGFIRELKARYSDRYVVVDSPAILDYPADARTLADICDFVILVVPYAMVNKAQVKSAIKSIGQNKLAGVVFNNI